MRFVTTRACSMDLSRMIIHPLRVFCAAKRLRSTPVIESWDTRLPSSRCIRSAPRHWWGLSRLVVWALQTALRLHGTDQKWHLINELYTVLAKCCLHNVWHCLAETSARRAGLHRFRTTSPWRARSRNICAVPSDSVSTSTPSLPMGTALWTGKASPYRINSSVR